MGDQVADIDWLVRTDATDSGGNPRCRALLSALDDGVAVVDDDGRVTFVDERAAGVFGRSRGELLDVSVDDSRWDLVDEAGERLEPDDGLFERIAARGEPVRDRTVGVRNAAGERVWLSVDGAPQWDDAGEFDGAVFVFEDCTDRRKLERELDETLGRVTDAFYALDDEFRFTHVNERAEELLQAPESELLGETLWDVYPESADIDDVWEAFHTAMDDQEAQSYELYYDPLDFWVEANLYPSDTGVSVYFRDVTDRKEREAERAELLREMRESEERLRLALDAGEMGTWELDLRTGEFVDRSSHHDRIFGYEEPRDDWGLDAFLDHVHPADRSAVERRFEPPFETGSWKFECRITRTDGRERVIAVQGEFSFDDAGDPVRAVGVVQDVTERRERERRLEDAKTQLEVATEAGAVGTWEWHVPTNRMTVGPSFARTFGLDPADAREGVPLERFLDAIHEDDRERVSATIQAAVGDCGEYEAEYRVWNADDELRWVVARGHVECDEDGEAETFPGALTDITDRKRAEMRAEKQSRELETLFQVLPVGAVVANADGSLRRANDTAREIWGGDVFDSESIEEYEKFAAQWADSGEPVGPRDWTMYQVLQGEEVTEPNVYEIDAFDGERRIIMEHGKPVLDEGGDVSRALVTLTDITERREAQRKLEETVEQLAASNERLEQFAYAASHDLQEPLRMVTSYLSLLESRYADAFDEDGREFLEFAVDGAERMRDMIDALLEYSRVETQGDPFEPVDLEEVLDAVVEDLQIRIDETDATVTADDLPRVAGDPSQLRQVLQNLLDNALTYRGDGPPTVHVGATRRGAQWEISVRDDGIGIDPTDQDRVFTVFDRLHSRDEYEGMGIGLALCQRIVERHDGDIWVDSVPGEGTTFSFTLPAAE